MEVTKQKHTSQVLAKDFKKVRLKRLKGFRDGYQVKFEPGALRCPTCNKLLLLDYVIVSSWPYIHGDYCLICLLCGEKYLFGIPEDPVVGMELIIWDSHPDKALKRARQEPIPVCPFHIKKMKLTKIFGDYIRSDGKLRLQWKCAEWFLTDHRDVSYHADVEATTPTIK
jgi:hypothetical protein